MKTLLLSLLLCASVAQGQRTPPVLEIGSDLPHFSLKGIDGKVHTPADYKDARILCFIFTSNHCPSSVKAAPLMADLAKDYADKPVQIIAISSNSHEALRPDEMGHSPYGDTYEEMKPFADHWGWTFPYLYDADTQSFAIACGAQSTPHVFIFDQARKLRYSGRIADLERNSPTILKNHVSAAFDSLLAGDEISEPVTRAIGCSTKWLSKKDSVVADQKTWEEKPVTLAELDAKLAAKLRENQSGNVRMINFWSTTCGPCVAEFPLLVDTYRRFQLRNMDFISISLDPIEDKDKVRDFLESRHAALADNTVKSMKKEARASNNYIWSEPNADRLAEALYPEWTGALPLTIILAPGGEVLWTSADEVDPVELRSALIKALEK